VIDVNAIESKRQKLIEVGESLKKDFVGLDLIIDRIITSIEVWYTFPELLTHPLIINLWGMTGVGKTDLVRKLVSKLSLKENYLEIQLISKEDRGETIQSKLSGLNITSNKQAILLLDEIQRFSSLTEKGEMIRNNSYTDIWELLSDGSFSDAFQEKYELQNFLYGLLYEKDQNDEDEDEDKEVDEIGDVVMQKIKNTPSLKPTKKANKKFKNYVWAANKFKMITESALPIEQIMQLSLDEQIDAIYEKLDSLEKDSCCKKYNNLLIFICGNLDKAYNMSSDVSEVDTDADILYERTKKISIIDIKKSLLQKFKPEQIARMGNNHIIYTSLNKNNFKDLIKKCLAEVVNKFYKVSNIKVNFSSNIHETIYQNGVFPNQGVRPVFSTITHLIENSLPEFLLKAFKDNVTQLNISFHKESSSLLCEYGDFKYYKKVQLDIGILKNKINKNVLSLVSAHEIGHVVIYMHLFNTVPGQVCCDAVNFAEGFVVPHEIRDTKEYILKLIQVCLGGKVAEEYVFGESNAGTGSSSDITVATSLASNMVRAHNMDEYIGRIGPETEPLTTTLTNLEDTDPIIEQILKEQKKKAFSILNENYKLFKILTKELLDKKKLLSEDIFNIATDFLPNLKLIDLKNSLEYNYSDALSNFLAKNYYDL